MRGKMNIDFEEVYDEEDDIYYVSFKTGEPSFVVEVEGTDNLLLEVGVFSRMPTGFRILEFSKDKIKHVQVGVIATLIKKTIHETAKESTSLRNREVQVEKVLESVLN